MGKGTAAELAGLGRTQTQSVQGVRQGGQNRPTAMDMELGHILAGEAGRAGKPEDQGPIEHLARPVIQGHKPGLPGWRKGAIYQ